MELNSWLSKKVSLVFGWLNVELAIVCGLKNSIVIKSTTANKMNEFIGDRASVGWSHVTIKTSGLEERRSPYLLDFATRYPKTSCACSFQGTITATIEGFRVTNIACMEPYVRQKSLSGTNEGR
jgi:hypothetical protein